MNATLIAVGAPEGVERHRVHARRHGRVTDTCSAFPAETQGFRSQKNLSDSFVFSFNELKICVSIEVVIAWLCGVDTRGRKKVKTGLSQTLLLFTPDSGVPTVRGIREEIIKEFDLYRPECFIDDYPISTWWHLGHWGQRWLSLLSGGNVFSYAIQCVGS